ncbi:carotenoid ester lipase precursor [Hymenopellis radicata]|nr:carotenoid ester lipase precursor [Hymenopellis radicata]
MRPSLFSFFVQASVVFAAASPPVVKLDDAVVTGTIDGRTHKFLGIPFGQPPTGDLRFQLPQPVDAYTGALNASVFGPACPQQAGPHPGPYANSSDLPAAVSAIFNAFNTEIPSDEDCLSINVVKPADTRPHSGLPVAVWFYGGGFEVGGSAGYNGSIIVDRSLELGEPIIYVSFNYRVSAWGFLASKEVKAAGVGNLGLQDQRLALKWVRKYIAEIRRQVNSWGESAGSMSATTQMLVNDGDTEGLFRGVFVHSGSPLPTGDLEHGQQYYDAIVKETGCAGSVDTLACLRTVPYDTLQVAVNRSPFIFGYQVLVPLAFMPRTDGVLLSDNAQRLIEQGKVAQVPIVSGECDDEGTLFSVGSRNITTDAEFKEYLQTVVFPLTGLPAEDLDTILNLYPQAVEEGSPFGTGSANAITPEYKRMSALMGDIALQGPRRFFLSAISGKQDIYTYLWKRNKDFPVLGAFHDSDVRTNVYVEDGGDLQDYVIRFVAHLDPNGDTGINWPKWTLESPRMLSLNDGAVPQNITEDTYRKETIETLNKMMLEYPF